MALESSLWSIIVLLFVIIISALPLYFAVTLLGGRISILRALFVMVLVGVSSVILESLFSSIGLFLAWLLMIWIFKEVFSLGWIKALLAWIMWLVFIVIFSFIFSLFGFSLLIFN